MRSSGTISGSIWGLAAGLAGLGLWIGISGLPLAGALTAIAGLFCAYLVWYRAPRVRDAMIVSLESEVRDAKGTFQQVVENLPVGLFMFREGQFTYTNWAWDEQMMRLPGQAPEQAFLKALDQRGEEHVLAELCRFEGREEPFSTKFDVHTEFGEARHIESQGVPVYGRDGNFLHVLGFNVDVTSATRSAIDLDIKNKALEKALVDLEDNLEAMVASLVKAIEAKDKYTAGHSARVMEYSVRLGRELGLSDKDMRILRMGTLIHDIGKIGVPDSVLSKPDKLTAEEFDIIKRHPITGHMMIREIPFFKDCAPIVRWHHERLNGRGYPDGLHGEEIPLLVQISTIADMFDAMTSNRAYRRSLGPEVALSELRADAIRGGVNAELVELWAEILVRDGMLQDVTDLPAAA